MASFLYQNYDKTNLFFKKIINPLFLIIISLLKGMKIENSGSKMSLTRIVIKFRKSMIKG